MSIRFYSPSQQFSDAAGIPLAGGTLTFYISGTSTLLATYSDSALTLPNLNPVVLDSAGRAGNIFLGSQAYRVVLNDANGNQIWTADPVSGNLLTSLGSVVSTGAGNAYSVSIPGFTATDGSQICFKASFTNGNNPTVSVNGGTPFPIFKLSSSGFIPVSAGDIQKNEIVCMVFNSSLNGGAGGFQLLTVASSSALSFAQTILPSAATTDLGSAGSNNVLVTGTATVNSFGASASLSNPIFIVSFTNALTLVENATSLQLPGGANITTGSGDSLIAEYLGSGNWQVLFYQRASTSASSQIKFQQFTASGNFITPTNTTVSTIFKITAVGAGGGGGGVGGAGQPGGQTSAGTFAVAGGGAGGPPTGSAQAGAIGGTATAGDILIGGAGAMGNSGAGSSSPIFGAGTPGANSTRGGAGAGGERDISTGGRDAALNSGSGGGGAFASVTTTAAGGGGAGATAIAYVAGKTPGTTIAITIGSGGVGGITSGGRGGDGHVLIEWNG